MAANEQGSSHVSDGPEVASVTTPVNAPASTKANEKSEKDVDINNTGDDDDDTGTVVSEDASNEKAPEKDVEKNEVLPPQTGKLPEAHNPDDGGLWGWMAVVGSWLIQFTGFGYANAFGVYQDYYTRIYLTNYSTSTISWIGSTQLFLQLSAGLVAGRMFDKGYFYSIVIGGSILYVFSLFMLSLAKPEKFYQIFLSQAIGGGIGSGLAYVPSIAILAQHFTNPHQRALVMTLVASGSSFGGVIHPIMLNNLINGRVGFANGVRASAGMIGGCLLLAISVMRTKWPKAAAVAGGGEEKKRAVSFGEGVKKFSKEPAYMLFVIGMFIFSLGLFYPIFYIQLDALKHNVDSNFAFYSLSILNALSMVGRIVPGFLSRRVGVINMITFTAICCGAVIFGMFGLHDRGSVAAVAIFFGLFSGAYVTLLAPTLTMLADHPSEIGARIGIGFAFQGLGGLIGTPIIGALLTTQYHWWRGTVYAGVLCGASGVFFLVSRLQVKKKKNVTGWII